MNEGIVNFPGQGTRFEKPFAAEAELRAATWCKTWEASQAHEEQRLRDKLLDFRNRVSRGRHLDLARNLLEPANIVTNLFSSNGYSGAGSFVDNCAHFQRCGRISHT